MGTGRPKLSSIALRSADDTYGKAVKKAGLIRPASIHMKHIEVGAYRYSCKILMQVAGLTLSLIWL